MYLVTYCQIKLWVRARLRPLVNSRLINLSHQIQWTLQTCLNLCWSYIQNRNALLDRELSRGMVLFCHILKTLCTSHPSTAKTNSLIKTPVFSLCILFLSAPHLDYREKKIQESCSRLSQKFSGLLKQNPQLHWNNQQVSNSLCWFTCIGTIFCQKRWRLFICSGVKSDTRMWNLGSPPNSLPPIPFCRWPMTNPCWWAGGRRYRQSWTGRLPDLASSVPQRRHQHFVKDFKQENDFRSHEPKGWWLFL